MRRLLAIIAAAVVAVQGGDAWASTAQTQARLATARPVATQAVAAPPPPVAPEQPTAPPQALAQAPRPDLPPPRNQTPAPARASTARGPAGPILLFVALLALVTVVRWFARRRQSTPKRV
ncbi:hypothetical protein [Caulobacter sp. BP25]|uniref:hypothetical protein n=1 Tax=Caulobacter sp. BP25 TaxID=2048900 RepID=UPI00117F4761|nr:hypothetical protein [Caulobacter sp. BP25]